MKLKNVKIINYNQTIENADILIENGFITEIKSKSGAAESVVIPGFIDLHIHGYAGFDVMEKSDSVEKISVELKKVGTTTFLPTVMTQEWSVLLSSLSTVANSNSKGAKMGGIHLEGPFISKTKNGAHNQVFLKSPSKELIDEIIAAGKNQIKKLTFAPELFSNELISYLVDKKINLSIGHSDGKLEDVFRAANLGVKNVTHLWNAMSGIKNREPGILEGALLQKDLYCEIICDFLHVDKYAFQITESLKSRRKLIAITDALKIAGLPDGKSISGGFSVIKNGLKITIENTDTIAGSAINMHDNFLNLIENGWTLNDAVAATSFNAAESMGWKLGLIKVGYAADIIVLDKLMRIKSVLVDGK